MPCTTVTFTRSDRVYTEVYTIGTHNVTHQLTAAGVVWDDGKKRHGKYQDWQVVVKSHSFTNHKSVKLPDFFDW